MFNSKKLQLLFIFLFFFFIGCGGSNTNLERECDPCDPNALVLYLGSDLSLVKTESQIIVKNCYDGYGDVLIRMAWDGQNPNCSLREGNYFIDTFINPGECIGCEFNNHTSVQVCLFFYDLYGYTGPDGIPRFIPPMLIESCDVILTVDNGDI